MYRFGDNRGPSHGQRHEHDIRNDFTFTSEKGMPTHTESQTFEDRHYRPRARSRDGSRMDPRRDKVKDRFRQNNRDGRRPFKRRNVAAHERPLMASRDELTPERMLGMDDFHEGSNFIAPDGVSDSSEADMEMESVSSNDEDEPPRKKIATEGTTTSNGLFTAQSIPKWSNPDPYTVLPPPDETQRKKKDVVKLIKKARVTQEKSTQPTDASDQVADFISLNFDDGANEPSMSDGIGSNAGSTRGRSPTESNLGNRKRTHDDKIKSFSKRDPKPNRPKDGSILDRWQPRSRGKSTPWCTVDHSASASMGFWFHKEMCDFFEYVRPREYEDAIRNDLLSRLNRTISKRYDPCSIQSFGSFAAGIYLPTADMDVVMLSDTFLSHHGKAFGLSRNFYYQVGRFLEEQGITETGSLEVVAKARVPLVKFIDKVTGLRVDMSFENDSGLIANYTYQDWKRQYPAMPAIVTIVKQFLAMRGLDEVVSGGMGGFTVTCLVTSLLQLMPQLQSRNFSPEKHLGELLMEFLDLYGDQFNVSTTGIQLDPPKYFNKYNSGNFPYRPGSMDRLCIMDPNRSDNDISGGTGNIATILRCFRNAYKALQARMTTLRHSTLEQRKGQSILGTILAGDYDSFEDQRARLRQLYAQRLRDPSFTSRNGRGPIDA